MRQINLVNRWFCGDIFDRTWEVNMNGVLIKGVVLPTLLSMLLLYIVSVYFLRSRKIAKVLRLKWIHIFLISLILLFVLTFLSSYIISMGENIGYINSLLLYIDEFSLSIIFAVSFFVAWTLLSIFISNLSTLLRSKSVKTLLILGPLSDYVIEIVNRWGFGDLYINKKDK